MNPRILGTAMLIGAALVMPGSAGAGDAFKTNCAKCHGETGESDTSAGKTLKVPHLKGDAKVAGMSIDDIVAAVKGNAKHKSFVGKLSDDQIKDAAGTVKQIAGGK
jgi:mono/diheme cytochrome c family protein